MQQIGVIRTLRALGAEFLRRLWSRELHHVLTFNLATLAQPTESMSSLAIRPGKPQEIRGMMRTSLAQTDSSVEARTHVQIMMFLQTDIPTVYVGTVENELVSLCWMISSEQNTRLDRHFNGGVKPLEDGDVLLEFIYTVPEKRGLSYMRAMTHGLFRMAHEQGKQRAIAYVKETNTSSLRGSQKIGWQTTGTKSVRWRFFKRDISFTL